MESTLVRFDHVYVKCSNMQMKTPKVQFNFKEVEAALIKENKFITDLFSIVAFPERYEERPEEDEDEEATSELTQLPKLQNAKTSRATSLVELQKRLDEIRNKKKLTYKEKLQKKGLKNRMKKKSKREERNAQQKLLRAQKLDQKPIVPAAEVEAPKPTKPLYNSEGKIVFSKFDFSGIGKQKAPKTEKDPKKLLQNLQKQKEKLERLEAQGETDKAAEIKEKQHWKNALAKAQGEKVKDDAELLKKSVAKKEQKLRHSKKKWEKRIEGVKKAQEERQRKRTENLGKRKKEKKVRKLKTAVKKGKVVPGF